MAMFQTIIKQKNNQQCKRGVCVTVNLVKKWDFCQNINILQIIIGKPLGFDEKLLHYKLITWICPTFFITNFFLSATVTEIYAKNSDVCEIELAAYTTNLIILIILA